MTLSRDEMRMLFHKTVIVRKPTYGIVKGYHELPYVCLGASESGERRTVQVKGKVQVSPQFVIRPQHYQPSYEDIFGEDHVDVEISGRIFGFIGFPRRPVECKSEHLEVCELDLDIDAALSRNLDELDRSEDITTGVIITPDCRYYPVSIERFITSVLDDEFSC